MKKIFLFFAFAFVASIAYASEPSTHFFVWVNDADSALVYQLDEQPKVVYEAPRLAVLYVQGEEVLRLSLASGDAIRVTHGVYAPTPTAIEPGLIDPEQLDLSHPTQVGKYIIGGQLVIISDGHWYNANGNLIK